jgi:DNA-binding transcriptional ArsR family regulator
VKKMSEVPPSVHKEIIALAHESRRRILQVLDRSDDPMSPREVAATLQHPLGNVSYHVRVLAECHAVTLVRTKPVRGSLQHFYRPNISFIGRAWVRGALGIDSATGAA